MEPSLYFGFGGRNAGGRTIADDEAGRCRILSSIECGARSGGSGETLGLCVGSHLPIRARNAGRQSPVDGGVEASQAEE